MCLLCQAVGRQDWGSGPWGLDGGEIDPHLLFSPNVINFSPESHLMLREMCSPKLPLPYSNFHRGPRIWAHEGRAPGSFVALGKQIPLGSALPPVEDPEK